MANPKSKNGKSKAPREASTYRHPEADSSAAPRCRHAAAIQEAQTARHLPLRFVALAGAELGRPEPCARDGRGVNPRSLEAKSLEDAKDAAERLKAMSGPFLNWSGKAERLSFDVTDAAAVRA